VLADFEGRDYGDWQAEGEAFGTGPAQGTLDGQQPVSGFVGKGLVNTYLGGNDQKQGKLTSPPFTIDRAWISFLIGGGEQAGKTCINLIVDGKAVLTAHGKNNEKLTWHNWDVRPYQGKQATIQIVDAESGPWGHVNVDQIELRDAPRSARSGPLDKQNDFGTMGLALLGGKSENSDPPSEIPSNPKAQTIAHCRLSPPTRCRTRCLPTPIRRRRRRPPSRSPRNCSAPFRGPCRWRPARKPP
jgi:non-lysosomal glucosylceramidase